MACVDEEELGELVNRIEKSIRTVIQNSDAEKIVGQVVQNEVADPEDLSRTAEKFDVDLGGLVDWEEEMEG